MRVAHIMRKLNPAEWGGTETAIQRLFEGLRQHGVAPVVYCPRLTQEAGEDPLAKAGFEVRRFKAFVPVWGISEERRNQMVAVGGNLMSFDLVASLWRDRQAKLIHVHTLGRIGGIGLTIGKRRHLPVVLTIHGGVLDLPPKVKESFNAPVGGWEWGRLFGWLFQSHRLLSDVDAILTCNPREAELLQKKFPSKRVQVQPHGVPLEIYRQDQRAAAQKAFPQILNRQVLLSLGRIDPIKNQGWLLDQAPSFLKKHPRALLVLAGPCTDEPYGKLVAQKIKDYGLAERVLLTGNLPPNDPLLIGLLQAADVLLLQSLSETFGLVILEAWAAGAPVISSRASGPAALVQHGQNGWLFDLSEPKGFHEALDETLSNPERAKAMAALGGKIAEQYSVSALAGRMKNLYDQLIEEKQCVT